MTVKHFNKKRRRRHLACPVKGCGTHMYRTNTTGICGHCQDKFGCKVCGYVNRRSPASGMCAECQKLLKRLGNIHIQETRCGVAEEQRSQRLPELIRRHDNGQDMFGATVNAAGQRAG